MKRRRNKKIVNITTSCFKKYLSINSLNLNENITNLFSTIISYDVDILADFNL